MNIDNLVPGITINFSSTAPGTLYVWDEAGVVPLDIVNIASIKILGVYSLSHMSLQISCVDGTVTKNVCSNRNLYSLGSVTFK
jgi:hypothetical protein